MTISTALTVGTNYPDNILIEVVQTGDKWSGYVYLMRDGHIHTLLLSGENCFDSEEHGKAYLKETCEWCVTNYGPNVEV